MKRLDAEPRVLAILGLLAALKAAALVGLAEALARGIVGLIAGDGSWRGAVALGLAAALLRALVSWASQVYATRAALGAKERVRHELAAHLLAGGQGRAGAASAVATVGLDELDTYYRSVLPAVVTAATVPLLVGARILMADWVSALIIVLTVPLVPVFMALVGLHTQERADAASASLQRLSDHLMELARGLPVLVGLGRVEEQSAALRRISEENRVTTMATLRTAFLSSLVLELISTISVAVVAVFVGVRLVHGELPLAVGLVALILAPECFAPFRELGSAFHAAQDGQAALRRSRELTATPLPGSVLRADATSPAVRVEGLVVRYDDRPHAVLDGIDLLIEPGLITSIEGPSGSGKSTILGVLAGVTAAQGGSVFGIDPLRVAWVPQHPQTVGTTVLDELLLYAGDGEDTRTTATGILELLGLGAVADSDPARLSPGELRRLAVARGLLRVEAGASLLLLDEPTAHLDPAHARLVESAIQALRGRVTIVIASHEAGMTRLADRRVLLPGAGPARSAEEGAAPSGSEADSAEQLTATGSWRELAAFLRPAGWRVLGATLLGAGAALFAGTLTALSGWLIVRASEQPPIMYLLVAIVGVRFFGLGRAGLRYAERLLSHEAVLGSVSELRSRLWAGLAARGVGSRSLASGGSAIDYLVAAADRVRDLVPRVILPPAVAVVTSIVAVIAVAALHPAALGVLLGGLVLGLLIAPAVALLADRRASQATSSARSNALRQFSALVTAAGELRANGIAERMLRRLDAADAAAGRHARRTAGALGLGSALVVLACTAMAVLMIPASQGIPGPIAAVLVLLPLGLIDPLLALVDAVQQWPALSAALRKVHAVTAPVPQRGGRNVDGIRELELRGLSAAWPGSRRAAFGPLDATAERGDWIVVEGPSGAGKSTLLATLLGYLPASSGAVLVNGTDAATLDPSAMRSHIAWCPQEAHLFDSTIRGNLLLGRSHDDRPGDAEMIAALHTAGLGSLLAALPEGLDTRVGSGGDRLSGGERQRLAAARTLLSRADLVLLDEPTAHLDAVSAERLMTALREALSDRIVVLVSHHASERELQDVRLSLGLLCAPAHS